ncbi:MAG: glycosyltransferase [candidate division WOR-3 bacterium]
MSESKSGTVLIIIGGIGGETTEAKLYYKIFSNLYKNFRIYLLTLYSLSDKSFIDPTFLIELNTVRTLSPFRKLRNLSSWLAEVRRIKDRIKPIITFSFADPSNFLNVMTKTKTEKIVIRMSGKLSNIAHYQGGSKLYALLYKMFYSLAYRVYSKKASLITCVSNDVSYDLSRFGLRGQIVIYNPVDVEYIRTASNETIPEFFQREPYIVNVGRLTEAKGQWYLLRIFKFLKLDHPRLKLVIIGDGELKEYLTNTSRKLGLRTYVWGMNEFTDEYDVYFLGFQRNPFKYMAKAQLFVLTSLWEGLPTVLLEAMACGTTIVSTDCKSGPREIISPDTDFRKIANEVEFSSYGVLVPPLEVRYKEADEPLDHRELKLLSTINELLLNDTLRKNYSSQALRRAEQFDIHSISESWFKILKERGLLYHG